MNSGSWTPLAGGKQVARTARVPVSGRGGLVTGVALWTAPAERTGADHRPAMALSNYQRRSAKAAVKLHTLLDLRGPIPTMISISDGKQADVSVLDQLILEPGAFYVMDCGYVDFARLHRFVLAGARFVTRAKAGMRVHRLES